MKKQELTVFVWDVFVTGFETPSAYHFRGTYRDLMCLVGAIYSCWDNVKRVDYAKNKRGHVYDDRLLVVLSDDRVRVLVQSVGSLFESR